MSDEEATPVIENNDGTPVVERLVLVAISVLGFGAVVFLGLQAILANRSPSPAVLVFAAALVIVSNVSLVGAQEDVFVTAGLMVVMAAVTALHGQEGVLAAGIVGWSGGWLVRVFKHPTRSLGGNLLTAAFNCGEFALSAMAAAVIYRSAFAAPVGRMLIAASAAAVAYTIVNVGLVLISFVAGGIAPRAVWREMLPGLSGSLAFGLVGALVGQLYVTLGAFSLVFLIVPALVARRVYRSTLLLREAREQTIQVFMKALEVKDLYTARHTQRVANFACYIGEELGWKGSRLADLRHAALMHDIGKLAVSSRLLNKPDRLTEEEYLDIRRHNEVCVEILTRIEFLQATIPVASDRHGFFDASARVESSAWPGYIVAVADAFDAMTSTRAYRKALSQTVAFEELRRGKGTQFHPACVDALISGIERRGEMFGAGHEIDLVQFEVEPPTTGVGSAGLGNLMAPLGDRRAAIAGWQALRPGRD